VVRHTTQNPEGIECVIQRVVIGVIALSNIQRSIVKHSLGDFLADLDPKPSVDWQKSDCAADQRLSQRPRRCELSSAALRSSSLPRLTTERTRWSTAKRRKLPDRTTVSTTASKLPHPTPSVLRTSVLEGGATDGTSSIEASKGFAFRWL
jgi:hypothetical protein